MSIGLVAISLCLALPAAGAVRTVSRRRSPEATNFSIAAKAIGPMFPGVTKQLNLMITNPFDFAITVAAATVTVDPVTTVGGAPALGCDGTSNLVVMHDLAVSPIPVVVAPKSSRSLADLGIPQSQWPAIQMPDLPTDQDACQGVAFTLTYGGDAAAVTKTNIEAVS